MLLSIKLYSHEFWVRNSAYTSKIIYQLSSNYYTHFLALSSSSSSSPLHECKINLETLIIMILNELGLT
jgi:hypothetical protein